VTPAVIGLQVKERLVYVDYDQFMPVHAAILQALSLPEHEHTLVVFRADGWDMAKVEPWEDLLKFGPQTVGFTVVKTDSTACVYRIDKALELWQYTGRTLEGLDCHTAILNLENFEIMANVAGAFN
jgi:hypothetical protein